MIFHTRSERIQSPVWNHPAQRVKRKLMWAGQVQWHFLQLLVLNSLTSFGAKNKIFILLLKTSQHHKSDEDNRVLNILYKMLSLEALWFVWRHSSVWLTSGLFFRWGYGILTNFISKDKTVQFTLIKWAQRIVLLSTQIKCHATKKQLSIIFIHPHPTSLPLRPRSLSWCTAALVCYHSGGSQGRVKSLRRNIMVTITPMVWAVSQIQ